MPSHGTTPLPEILSWLESELPPDLSEEWDNTGLLLGDRDASIRRVLTCLTLTPDVAREAIVRRCQLIVTHHPILFRSVKRVTSDDSQGAMLLRLVQAGISVYSPHTSYDSAAEGINQQLANGLQLTNIKPLRPLTDSPEKGSGRYGMLPEDVTLAEFCQTVSDFLKQSGLHAVGDPKKRIRKVGIACGAAAEYLSDAHTLGCDVLLTGEARFHSALEARSTGIAMVLPGHYATERHAMEQLAARIDRQFDTVDAFVSDQESDPLRWIPAIEQQS